MDLHPPSFLIGFLIGFAVAMVTGILVNKIYQALEAMLLPDRPMVVRTAETPRTVMQRAARAARRFIVLLFWLVLWVVLVAAFLYNTLWR
ncbi:MAG: hypothetical protein KJZ93_17060 [Caldilineaceae bacterium]|nr:hypothetical protein [Caldilineaceae bacterium]